MPWALVGTELNRMRAMMLPAEVHALLGHGSTSLGFAAGMRAFYAHCAHAAGETELYETAYREAARAIAAVADEEDRRIVTQTFEQVPAP